MSDRKKILVFSVSAGAGHIRAAEAIRSAGERWFGNLDITHVDLMDLVPKLFRKIYADSYIKIVEKHPALWGYLYDKTDQEKADSSLNRIRIAVERLNTTKIKKVLRELDPDVIICTHFLPAQILSLKIQRGLLTKPVWVVDTDFDVHALWVQPHMAGYFAACDEVLWRMVMRGIPRDRIHVTGIPIMPVFGDMHSREECAREFGLDPKRTTFLMMSGGVGIGGLEILAEELLKLEGDFQLIGLAGKNEHLLGRLNEIAALHPGRLLPIPFTRVIERVMAASDVAITKPGGLTTSECLAMGLPMIVVSPIPGQEDRNSDYLLENSAAMKACDGGALSYRINLLLREPQRLDAMRKNALRCGRPDAAKKILEHVIQV